MLAKLGKAATAVDAITSAADVAADAGLMAALEPYRELSPAEVAVLPARTQFLVPQISCETLSRRPIGSISDPKAQAVVCESGGEYPRKLLLDVAKVEGSDVDSAAAVVEFDRWSITVDFTDAGQAKWTPLSTEAANNEGCAPAVSHEGHSSVAVTYDDVVLSRPTILQTIPSGLPIVGRFSESEARSLAASISGGELPALLRVESIEVSVAAD